MLELILFCALCGSHPLPDAPTPKPIARAATWHTITKLTVAHAAVAGFDGWTTKRFERYGYTEAGPMARAILGRNPTWPGMIAAGAVEVTTTNWLVAKHPRMKWICVALIAWHAEEGIRNLQRGPPPARKSLGNPPVVVIGPIR